MRYAIAIEKTLNNLRFQVRGNIRNDVQHDLLLNCS
jgi:hypothetical protein